MDRTVRLWDLNYGMPLSISRPHGGIVRSVALDQNLAASGSSDNVVRLWHARHSTAAASLLDPAAVADEAALLQGSPEGLGLAEGLMVMDGPADRDTVITAGGLTAALTAAGAAATGNSSVALRNGVLPPHGPYSIITGEADESLFDLSLPAQHLRGHIGPVTSLCLTESCLYSGSWDYTVRCWRRGSWDCIRCGSLWILIVCSLMQQQSHVTMPGSACWQCHRMICHHKTVLNRALLLVPN